MCICAGDSDICQNLQRYFGDRHFCVQPQQGQEGEDWAHPAHARQQPRGHQGIPLLALAHLTMHCCHHRAKKLPVVADHIWSMQSVTVSHASHSSCRDLVCSWDAQTDTAQVRQTGCSMTRDCTVCCTEQYLRYTDFAYARCLKAKQEFSLVCMMLSWVTASATFSRLINACTSMQHLLCNLMVL